MDLVSYLVCGTMVTKTTADKHGVKTSKQDNGRKTRKDKRSFKTLLKAAIDVSPDMTYDNLHKKISEKCGGQVEAHLVKTYGRDFGRDWLYGYDVYALHVSPYATAEEQSKNAFGPITTDDDLRQHLKGDGMMFTGFKPSDAFLKGTDPRHGLVSSSVV